MEVHSNAAALSRHEAVCAERWLDVRDRVDIMQKVLIGSASGICLTFLGVVVDLIIRFSSGH